MADWCMRPHVYSVAARALRALEQGDSGPFDVVLLDVLMPLTDGWECLSELRSRGRKVPVIFVSAKEAVEDRVRGLELGADDYVTKPFSLRELVARVRAVVERRRAMPQLEYGPLSIDLGHRRVWFEGREIGLAKLELDLLTTLVQAAGETVTRTALLEEVWNMGFDPGTNVVDVTVARVRRKLGRRGAHLICSVYGKGYRLKPLEPPAD